MSVYENIIAGLKEAIEYEKGNAKARTSKWTVKDLPELTGDEIRKIRMDAGYTQVTFALLLGVSTKTVEAWERGRNLPQGPAKRLMSLMLADIRIFERCEIITHEMDAEPKFIREPSFVTTTSSESMLEPIEINYTSQSNETLDLQNVVPVFCY